MSLKSQTPEPSRLEKMRCQAQARAADAALRAQTAAGAAQTAATGMAGMAQTAAQTAAVRLNERGGPMAREAAVRGAAAYQILLHGVPRSGLARMMPTGAQAGPAMRRARGPMLMMAVGGVGAAGVLAWRRSRQRDDDLWVVDVDDDARAAAEGWDEGSARSSAREDRSETPAEGDHMDHPSRRWP